MAILLIICLLLAPFVSTADHDAPDSDRIKTIRSLKKLDDFPLYTMRFYGDYDLPNYALKVSLTQGLQSRRDVHGPGGRADWPTRTGVGLSDHPSLRAG